MTDVNESRTLRHMIGYKKKSGTPTCMYVKEDVADDRNNAKTHENKRRTKGLLIEDFLQYGV